ncbi:hypothetical protein [Rhizobium sp. BK176]|uniref:hypothetical protein n=1 Tax=Rhizobium sp. BK176 TaxID=2587071 RepID=UPI00216980D4|nr:hypothetical protein [Rhizobium sp. BK176]MCS4088421.1 hypothetical protein [Rhizobium sp. BK176]
MHIEGLVEGCREFKPEPTTVLHASEKKTLTSASTVICRETADIVWVRSSLAIAYLSFKGKVVKRLESHNDFYGFLSSARGLCNEAPSRVKHWQIERDSELELHVVGWVEDSPTVGYEKVEYGRRYYKPLAKHVWLDSPDAKVGEAFNFDNFPFESRKGLGVVAHTATIVWKSSWSDEENLAAFAAYEALAKAETRTVIDTGVWIPVND